MRYTKQQLEEIRIECRSISRNAGLLFGRIVLLCCLFPLFFSLRPTSIYLFAAFSLFPAILSSILAGKKKYARAITLESCAKKYFYSYHRYIVEKYTAVLILFSLILWQVILTARQMDFFLLQRTPAICMFVYLVSRIVFTERTKRKISRYYGLFEILES